MAHARDPKQIVEPPFPRLHVNWVRAGPSTPPLLLRMTGSFRRGEQRSRGYILGKLTDAVSDFTRRRTRTERTQERSAAKLRVGAKNV